MPNEATSTLTVEQHAAKIEKLDQALVEARRQERITHDNVRTARAKTARALAAWTAEFPPLDPVSAAKQFIVGEQKKRQQIADGEVPGSAFTGRVFLTQLDHNAAYSKGRSVEHGSGNALNQATALARKRAQIAAEQSGK